VKAILIAMLTGFVVALVVGPAWLYVFANMQGPAVSIFGIVIPWIWPTAFLMFDAEQNWQSLPLFLFSSVANAFVYGTVMLCMVSVRKMLSRSEVETK
jgi:hypothetical protein